MSYNISLTVFTYKNNDKQNSLNTRYIKNDLVLLLHYSLYIIKCERQKINVLTDIKPNKEVLEQLMREFSVKVIKYCNYIGYNDTVKRVGINLGIDYPILYKKILDILIPKITHENVIEFAYCFTNLYIIYGRESYKQAYEKVFKECKNGDKLLFYYTGHGELHKEFNLLIPKEPKQEYITNKEFEKDIEKNLPTNIECVFIFDCCYSQNVLDMKYVYRDETILKNKEYNNSISKNKEILFISSTDKDQECGFYYDSIHKIHGSLFTYFFINKSNFTFKNLTKDIQHEIDLYRISKDNKMQEICISSNSMKMLQRGSLPKWMFKK